MLKTEIRRNLPVKHAKQEAPATRATIKQVVKVDCARCQATCIINYRALAKKKLLKNRALELAEAAAEQN